MPNISTGQYLSQPCADVNRSLIPDYGDVGSILFSPESPLDVDTSPVMRLRPGEMAFVEVYNMPASPFTITVERVIVGSYPIPNGTSCSPCGYPETGMATVMYSEPMSLGSCSAWQFRKGSGNDSRTQMIILYPGSYIFRVSNPVELGTMFMCYTIMENVIYTVPTQVIGATGDAYLSCGGG